ncbi:MAG: outer membrane protein transport protein [Desulfuromusa sp.]|nr:outer membrane protein transport protein [Desulfuromusa sp.]
MWKKSSASLIGLVLLLAASSTAFASGFALIEQSVSGLGNAFAGGAASAEDPTTVFFNPAGMTRLEGQQVNSGLHLIIPSAKLSPSSAENSNGNPITGSDGGDGGESGVAPNLYYTNKLNDILTVGLGINAPFGLATKYDRDWIGRYHAVESEVMTININPSFAIKATDKLSLGAGLNIQYIDATLSAMVDVGNNLTGNSSPATDVFVENKADDWSMGYNLGLLYEFTEATRVGFAYRSKIRHSLEGHTTTEVPTALAGVAFLFPDKQGVNGKIALPASASLSLFHQLNDQWAIMTDINWTEWSSFEELTLNFEGAGIGGNPSTTTLENWEDTWRYSVGTSYAYNESLVLRGGLAYDETPIKDNYRTPRIPGEDRYWITLGAGITLSQSFVVDIAYAHLFVDDSKINLVSDDNDSAGYLTGEYENQVDIASVALTYRF